ncbi:unnamed protein product [Calypogeia fissa]
MGRALRRTLSPQIKDRVSSGSSGGLTMLLNGGRGGSVVFAVEEDCAQNVHRQQNNHVSSFTSLTGCITGSATSLSTAASSHSDNLSSISNLALIFPLPCVRNLGRTGGGSMDRPQKSSRGVFWKRPMLHLLLCLVLGIVMGFTSLSWSDFPSRRDETPRDVALVNGFVSNLQREGFRSQGLGSRDSGSEYSGHTVHRGEKLYEYESVGDSFGSGEVGHATLTADNTRALQLEHLKSGSFELAPGLNYDLDPERKLLIIVTPTYNRPFQAHYLTRLAHTLRLVPPPLLWLVVEMPYQTLETASVLMQTGIMYRHLVCRTNLTNVRDRVVHQRNFAMEHIELHQFNGIVYFADDDNVYSPDLFEELRMISRFGTWPVAILGEGKARTLLEGPVCEEERVIGWHTTEKSKNSRRFHVGMSGFAFNSTILWDTVTWRHRNWQPIRQLDTVAKDLQETTLIEQLVEDENQMQGLASGCSRILVWHMHMEAPELAYPYGWSLAKPLFPNIPFQTQT